MNKYKLVKHTRFDIDDARTHEWYSLLEWKKNFFSNQYSWKPAKVYVFDMGGGGKEPAKGDALWAMRIAKHFKIDFPK